MTHQERMILTNKQASCVMQLAFRGWAIITRPHVSETLARCLGCFLSPMSALRRVDLPTFDLPTKASSGRRVSGGGICRSAAPAAPRQTGKGEGARVPGHGERNGGESWFECRGLRYGQMALYGRYRRPGPRKRPTTVSKMLTVVKHARYQVLLAVCH